jgi:hypothetical protein
MGINEEHPFSSATIADDVALKTSIATPILFSFSLNFTSSAVKATSTLIIHPPHIGATNSHQS